jgi:hypothetical protein
VVICAAWLISDVRQKMRRTFVLSLICMVNAGCVAPKMSLTQIHEAGRSGICCVHHVSMKKKSARILYGFTVVPAGAADVEYSYFPFAQRRVSLGHVLPSVEGPFLTEIFVCDECNAAKARWIRRHPGDRRTLWWQEDLKEPNKALEPTTMAVTPRAIGYSFSRVHPAGARGAPAMVVAHL